MMDAMTPPDTRYASPDTRWAAVRARDAAADGAFFYAVITTGVYCRPSCPSRGALRRNVEFFEEGAAAVAAGYRPCKRCRPDGPSQTDREAAAVARACRLMEEAEEMPLLADMAAAAGLSRHHFHRVFKKVTGVTPRAFAAERRAGRVRDALSLGASVTAAIHDAGYAASSRFYGEAAERLGMKPSEYGKGGRGVAMRFAIAETTLGKLLVAATDKGVCCIQLGDDEDSLVAELKARFPEAEILGGDLPFEGLVAKTCAFVERPTASLDLPLDIQGTAFQQRVWAALREIPLGTTSTYTEVAGAIGAPSASRAVAGACAANPVALAVPCHRVVRADGSLSGYRWGTDRKKALLEREGAR